MRTKHTPGPWRIETGGFVVARDKLLVANTLHQQNDGEERANGRLIASGPELLESVRRLWAAIENGTVDSEHYQLRAMVRRVFAKVEGAQ